MNQRRRFLNSAAPWLFGWIALTGLVGPSAAGDGATRAGESQFQILATFLPVHVLTLNVVGEAPGVQVELMVSADAGCPHHYALRPSDLKKMARAQLVIANGLDMEPFLDQLTRNHPSARVLTISDDCQPITCEHDHEDGAEHDHEHGSANGHVWVSPRQAAIQVRTLARKLADADPSRAAIYASNGDAFAAKLQTLHDQMVEVAATFRNRKIVTGHDAFAYLARDLNLEVVATFEAEPDQAPSALRMVEVVRTIKNTKAAAVFFEPGPSERLARTLAAEAGVAAYPLNPLTRMDRAPTAASYEEIMRENLKTLQRALGGGP